MKIDLTKKVDDVVSILSIEENRDDLWPGEYPHILTMEAEYTNWYMLQKKGQKLCISIYEGEDCVVAMSLDAKQINKIIKYLKHFSRLKETNNVISKLSIKENRDDLWPGDIPHILKIEPEYDDWMITYDKQKLYISIYEGEDYLMSIMSLDVKQINKIIKYLKRFKKILTKIN